MDFDQRLHDTRKERGLTQEGLAERVGIHVSQIRRYEAGTSVPTLDVLRNLATTLAVSTDFLVFDDAERDPDDELRFQFETVAQLDPEDRAIIRASSLSATKPADTPTPAELRTWAGEERRRQGATSPITNTRCCPQ